MPSCEPPGRSARPFATIYANPHRDRLPPALAAGPWTDAGMVWVRLDRPPITGLRGSIASLWVTPTARVARIRWSGRRANGRQFLPSHVQKDTLPLLSVKKTILHSQDNGPVDWQMKRPKPHMSKPHLSSRLHISRFCMRLCMLTAVGMASWPCSVGADTNRTFVVIMPPVRPPSPPERAVPAQPTLQWAPPPAMGLTPGLRSPTALCYAGASVCPLTQPEHIGEPCTCGTGGPLLGRTLIPPSHDISGTLRHTN